MPESLKLLDISNMAAESCGPWGVAFADLAFVDLEGQQEQREIPPLLSLDSGFHPATNMVRWFGWVDTDEESPPQPDDIEKKMENLQKKKERKEQEKNDMRRKIRERVSEILTVYVDTSKHPNPLLSEPAPVPE
jgi:hypothetical protein